MNWKNSILLSVFATLTGVVAVAPALAQSVACKNVHIRPSLSHILEKDPFEQWLLWEQEANFSPFRKERTPIQIGVSHVSPHDVKAKFLKSTPGSLKKFVFDGKTVRYFKHPFNTRKDIPHINDATVEQIPAYQTASRSVALKIGGEFYTLKMPTDYPHGPTREYQPAKASVKEDILDGINRMEYIERVDQEIGLDPDLILAKETAMIADRKTGEGYLFRELSFMKSGKYYLPALSIPYIGREIAQQNGVTAEVLWKKAYAEVLGRAKAKLLLRYGAQMETPNSQNMLIELNRDLKPTGRIVFRDISDTILINGVAEGLGETAVLAKDKDLGVENGETLQPYWANSAWRFDEAGTHSFSRETLKDWGSAHDQAYRQEIEKALGVDLSAYQVVDGNRELSQFMASDIVKKKLHDYREKLKAEHEATHGTSLRPAM
jgi:hypothetical protein